MDPVVRGPVEYPLSDLSADQFEALTFLLARTHDPAVVPVRNKDHGLDARLPDIRGRTVRGWQAKRFTQQISWVQCRASVERAIAFWRPPHITFTFPIDLSAAQQAAFRTELIERFPHVRIDFWPASEIQRLMRDTDEGRRAAQWLYDHPKADYEAMLRALKTGAELSSPVQAAERQAAIQEFMDRDPHVQYTLVSRSPGAPETPASSEAFLSVSMMVGAKEIRFDASERYQGALEDLGGPPRLVFSADEAGARARASLERLAQEGGRETITSGLGAVMPSVPVGLRGLMPEEPIWSTMEVTASERRVIGSRDTPGTTVVVSAGGTEVAIVLSPLAQPHPGWDVSLAGSAGGLELFQLGRLRPDGKLDLKMEWRYKRGEGTGLEQLLATRLLLAAFRGSPVELHLPDGAFLSRGVVDLPDSAADDIAQLSAVEQFLCFVAEVEAWLGEPLQPPAEPTDADLAILGQVLGQIRKPVSDGHGFRAEFHPTAEIPDHPVTVAVLQPLRVHLFGEEVLIGTELITVPEAKADRLDSGEWVLEQVEGSETPRVTLYRPDQAPPRPANA